MELTDMNFRVDHSDFADAVAWVAHNIPSHPLEPILAGVLLTANDEGPVSYTHLRAHET